MPRGYRPYAVEAGPTPYSSTSRSKELSDEEYYTQASKNRKAAVDKYQYLKGQAQKATSIGVEGKVTESISDEKVLPPDVYKATARSNYKNSRLAYLESLAAIHRPTDIYRVPTGIKNKEISDEKKITPEQFLKQGTDNYRSAQKFYQKQISKTRTATHLAGEPFKPPAEAGIDPEEYSRVAQENYRHARTQYREMLARNE